HFAWENALSRRARWIPFLQEHLPTLVKVARGVSTREEVLALDWALTNLIPLTRPKPHPWFLTSYEELLESRVEWEKLCSYLDCPVPPSDTITRISSTAKRRPGERKPGISVDKWRKHLSQKQIDMILRVTGEMGVDFYDSNPFPQNLDKYR